MPYRASPFALQGKSYKQTLQQTLHTDTTAADPEAVTETPKDRKQAKPSAAVLDFEEKEPASEVLPLIAELVGAGLNRADAKRLAKTNSDECRRQLEYLPHKPDLENPGAYLRRAIEGSFGPPVAYHEAKKREVEAQKKRTQAEAQAAKKAQAEEVARQAVAALNTEIENLRSSSPESFKAFEEYIDAERKRIVSRFPSERIQETMNRDFAKPEKRRELYQQWKQTRIPVEALRIPVETRNVVGVVSG